MSEGPLILTVPPGQGISLEDLAEQAMAAVSQRDINRANMRWQVEQLLKNQSVAKQG